MKNLLDILPVYGVEHDAILSKMGDITVAFKVQLSELFTMSNDDYEAFHHSMVFMGGFDWAIVGMIVWHIGMGAQESILKAAVAELIPVYKRNTAFGLFNTGVGIFWFQEVRLWSIYMIIPISWLVAFSVLTQEIAVVILIVLAYHSKNKTVGNVRTKKIKLKHRY